MSSESAQTTSKPVEKAADPGIQLPDSIATSLALGKIQRELFVLDAFLTKSQAASRLPFISPELNKIIKDADVNPLQAADRERLTNQLKFVRRTAPQVQISFASEPSQPALRSIVRWFRDNNHPNTLITVGIQPHIAGGCVVRTASKEFDFSLQKLLQETVPSLSKTLAQV